MKNEFEVVTYDERFKQAFRSLNLEWIQKYFEVESKDLQQVDNPEICLQEGGQIFFVVRNGEEAVGTCAVYDLGSGVFEIAKMAVDTRWRGHGLGSRLMVTAEDWIRKNGGLEIIILSNTILNPAIELYKKHGFETIKLGSHPDYKRCNIVMKKLMTKNGS